MHELEKLKSKLCHELEEYSGRDRLDMQSLQVIDTIAHTVKNLNKILDEKAKEDQRYSEGYFYANDGRGYNNRGYSGGYSDRYPDMNRGNWNRYSMGNDMIIDRLRGLMNETHDERTRQEFQTFINRMEQM